MIVKFLSKSQNFSGVNYNTDKAEKGKGELVGVKNFGALEGIENLRPQDYINYLKAVSTQSKRIKFPQLHVVISCKGREKSKEELTLIAREWMKGMGYGDQPYLLVFHKDTANNHIHIVSTRVGKDGKKIDDSFEKLRAYQVLNRIMSQDEGIQADEDLLKALSYYFATRAQFMMILEAQGYSVSLKDDHYRISKFGKELATIAAGKVDARILEYRKDAGRIKQLRAIVTKYQKAHNPAIYEKKESRPGGREGRMSRYSSELAEILHQKFGLQVFFHAKAGKLPYGYTLIDHTGKIVYKGGDIMPLSRFTEPVEKEQVVSPATSRSLEVAGEKPDNDHAGMKSLPTSRSYKPEPSGAVAAEEEKDQECYQAWEEGTDDQSSFLVPGIDISDDIDDEAILGRNRRRKRKARTNSR